MIASFGLDGPIDRRAFETHVEKVLVPELRSGDIVIMDKPTWRVRLWLNDNSRVHQILHRAFAVLDRVAAGVGARGLVGCQHSVGENRAPPDVDRQVGKTRAAARMAGSSQCSAWRRSAFSRRGLLRNPRSASRFSRNEQLPISLLKAVQVRLPRVMAARGVGKERQKISTSAAVIRATSSRESAFSSRLMVGCEHSGRPLSGDWPTATVGGDAPT